MSQKPLETCQISKFLPPDVQKLLKPIEFYDFWSPMPEKRSKTHRISKFLAPHVPKTFRNLSNFKIFSQGQGNG